MSVAVYWDEETKACLRVELRQPWTWREFEAATQEAKDVLSTTKDALGFIVDVREAGNLPPAGFVTQSRNSLQELPPLPMVFVANTPIMQIIFQPIQQLFRIRRQFYYVHNIEEAREVLRLKVSES